MPPETTHANRSSIAPSRKVASSLVLALLFAVPCQVFSQDDDEDSVTIPGGVPSILNRRLVFDDAREWASQLEKVDAKAFSGVEEVDVYWYADRGLMELIASFPRLDSLYIHQLHSSVDFEHILAPIAEMKRLEYLEISMVEVKQRRCAFLRGLKSLEVFKCDAVIGESDLSLLAGLPHLKTLHVSLRTIRSGEPRNVSNEMKRGFSQLGSLAIDSGSHLHYFANAKKLEELSILSPIRKDDIEWIRHFDNLRRLHLAVRSVDWIPPICKLPKLSSLEVRLDSLTSRRQPTSKHDPP